MNLKEAHADYIQKCRAAGETILTYRIVTCGHEEESPAAPSSDTWGTWAQCSTCGAVYFKITKGSTITTLEMLS